jgi:hypothetical protein
MRLLGLIAVAALLWLFLEARKSRGGVSQDAGKAMGLVAGDALAAALAQDPDAAANERIGNMDVVVKGSEAQAIAEQLKQWAANHTDQYGIELPISSARSNRG